MKPKDATAYDAAAIGPSLREMADELAGRKPLGSGEVQDHHAGGRPTVLSDEKLAKIAELRGAGWGYTRIADAVGVGRLTVRRVLGKDSFGKPCQNSQVQPERTRSRA